MRLQRPTCARRRGQSSAAWRAQRIALEATVKASDGAEWFLQPTVTHGDLVQAGRSARPCWARRRPRTPATVLRGVKRAKLTGYTAYAARCLYLHCLFVTTLMPTSDGACDLLALRPAASCGRWRQVPQPLGTIGNCNISCSIAERLCMLTCVGTCLASSSLLLICRLSPSRDARWNICDVAGGPWACAAHLEHGSVRVQRPAQSPVCRSTSTALRNAVDSC